MENILVATDFSKSATNAVEYAIELAMTMNCRLHLFHAYHIPINYGEVPFPVNEAERRENATTRLESLKKEILERLGGKIQVQTHLQEGIFHRDFLLACQRIKPDLVVMGSQGKSATERFIFGSHTIHAMKHLNCPLLTVPPLARFSVVRKVALACDIENNSDALPVGTIKSIVKVFNPEFHVLNIRKNEEYNPSLIFESGVLQEKLKDLNPHFHFITSEDTDETILSFTENNEINLLVVIPKIHGLLEKLNHRSHTKQFILHSHVPVLSIRQ
jgi:nucleotide-binding universal stress UspA family protein